MNLDELRTQIDDVDDSLVELFQKRMDIAAQIAEYKRENGLPILQSAREREKLAAISAGAPEEMQRYLRVLYSLLFELSRTYQGALYRSDTDLYRTITRAIEETPKVFPKQAAVACQGVEGAYAQLACERLFSAPSIQFFRNFDGIFSAIEAGLCRYGILPIENSTAGSVRQVYDRMLEHHFYIVRSVRMKIDHCLLAKPGTKEIHEVFSHEQAINQCAEFLKSLGKDVRVPVRRALRPDLPALRRAGQGQQSHALSVHLQNAGDLPRCRPHEHPSGAGAQAGLAIPRACAAVRSGHQPSEARKPPYARPGL